MCLISKVCLWNTEIVNNFYSKHFSNYCLVLHLSAIAQKNPTAFLTIIYNLSLYYSRSVLSNGSCKVHITIKHFK